MVVVGAGGAGMCAALAAAKRGLDTILVEKSAYFGGSTARSGGGVWMPANYALKAAGQADAGDLDQAKLYLDSIVGDVYSAGDVVLSGDAGVAGGVLAGGSITGTLGSEGVRRPLPDIAGMDYATNHDFDVASMFASAAWTADPLGGSAWQLPEDSPAHIFRKNPDDRPEETSGTVKDDFFLEDPYMPVQDFTVGATGMSGHTISLSGAMGRPGPSGTDKVYYVDGNLWVHNQPFGGLRFMNTDPEGARVTFVVKGNIYFSDDIYMEDSAKDGVAFIAIADEAVEDSGNIYMGDPRFGTINHMEAYLYAENDFYDNNLDATGSSVVTLVGNMTAGNHVAIDRDYVQSNGDVAHSKLTVEFDPRLSNGDVELPGIPGVVGAQGLGFEVVFWREIALQ